MFYVVYCGVCSELSLPVFSSRDSREASAFYLRSLHDGDDVYIVEEECEPDWGAI